MTDLSSPVRVLVVERLALLRRGFADSLATAPGLALVGSAATAGGGALLATSHRPAVAFVGTTLPDAPGVFAAVSAVRRAAPETGIVVIAPDPTKAMCQAAARAKAAACCGPDINDADLSNLVHRVAVGEIPLASGTTEARPLTRREWEVLCLLSRGQTNPQIALALGLSPLTIKQYVSAVMRKLGATDRTRAVTSALREGLITVADMADAKVMPPAGVIGEQGSARASGTRVTPSKPNRL